MYYLTEAGGTVDLRLCDPRKILTETRQCGVPHRLNMRMETTDHTVGFQTDTNTREFYDLWDEAWRLCFHACRLEAYTEDVGKMLHHTLEPNTDIFQRPDI